MPKKIKPVGRFWVTRDPWDYHDSVLFVFTKNKPKEFLTAHRGVHPWQRQLHLVTRTGNNPSDLLVRSITGIKVKPGVVNSKRYAIIPWPLPRRKK